MSCQRIFIVDDDRQVSLALCIRLKASGYDVAAAFDGESGLQQMRQYVPHLVLLDIRLPGIDGIEVMQQMKQDGDLSQIPVIFVSANAQEKSRRAALQAGGRLFLEKPFDARTLLQAIQNVLNEQPQPGAHA
ncbi:MAG: Transcriptional regulatory protein WalR [Phycisphaerae bacterium]|nr:Transcriptional regulatory protein WalR [Phycisphaerae bacterium]